MGETAEPKPLMPVGPKPILWHIMKLYATQSFTDFILCLGYKGEKVREYFEENNSENWNIQFVDTGQESTKSERILKIKHLIPDEDFALAYGDDIADIDLNKLLKFHEYMGLTLTLTAVKLISPFGVLELSEDNVITKFKEKPVFDQWMNGGFMMVNRKIFDALGKGELENEVFEHLVDIRQICAYKHKGNWKTMNTLKDSIELNNLWDTGKAFWKIW